MTANLRAQSSDLTNYSGASGNGLLAQLQRRGDMDSQQVTWDEPTGDEAEAAGAKGAGARRVIFNLISFAEVGA